MGHGPEYAKRYEPFCNEHMMRAVVASPFSQVVVLGQQDSGPAWWRARLRRWPGDGVACELFTPRDRFKRALQGGPEL